MAVTHQDIVDRMAELGNQQSAALKAATLAIAKERESLQELCAGLGHVFGEGLVWSALTSRGRHCVFCCKPEEG